MIKFSTTIITGIVITIGNIDLHATPQILGKPWHQNTREHLFGYVDIHDFAHCSTADEGFRWKNSFYFTVNGIDIDPDKWSFNKQVRVVKNARGTFFSNLEENGTKITFQKESNANLIQQHLSEIAWTVKNLNRSTVAATAAVTIIVQRDEQYYAYSKVVTQGILSTNKVLVALNGGKERVEDENLKYSDLNASIIRNNLLTNISPDLNLPFPGKISPDLYIGYSCVEGKILSELIANDFSLFKSQILELAKQELSRPKEPINFGSIHYIILHIHTTMDPCAICTRCLVGLSKFLNEGTNIQKLESSRRAKKLINANFFIEVSSNARYPGSQPDMIGSFKSYHNESSHTECSGHDDEEAIRINLQPKSKSLISDLNNLQLVCPGGVKSWAFNPTFPPYIVFGQINTDSHTVVDAPEKPTNHRHNCQSLPKVQ